MNNYSLVLPAVYFFVILGLSTYLLIRGITHTFVCLFAAAALIELIRSVGFFLMSLAPGGFSAHTSYMPALSAIGFLGMLAFTAGFVSLTIYLLRAQPPQA
jgi:hypothetical protein